MMIVRGVIRILIEKVRAKKSDIMQTYFELESHLEGIREK